MTATARVRAKLPAAWPGDIRAESVGDELVWHSDDFSHDGAFQAPRPR